MRHLTKLIHIASFLLVFTSISQKLYGQANTMYYLGNAPQSYLFNPATQPSCDAHAALPVFSEFYVNIHTSGLSGSDLLWLDPETDSLIHPFHPKADINEFLNNFGDVESLGLTAHLNLFSIGFRVKDMYFSLDGTIKANNNLTLSKDLMEFLLIGNEDGRTYDFSDVGFESLQYAEIGLNISRNFNDRLQIGIRPKYLAGLATISPVNNNTSLYTSTEEWVLTANYQARVAATGVTIPVDEDGMIDLDGEFLIDSTMISPAGYKKIFSSNWGLGIDLGVHFKPTERIQLSASVIDLGYIKWRENTQITSLNGTFAYTGLEQTLDDSTNPGDLLLDSLKESLNITGSNEAFVTTLHPKVTLGGRYFLTQGFDVGFLSRMDLYPSYVESDILLLANWRPIPMIAISGSYSLLKGNLNTFGLGLGLRLGPLNFYSVIDHLPFQYDMANVDGASFPMPVDVSEYSVKFGFNLLFGCNQKKKLVQDKPLFSSSDWIL